MRVGKASNQSIDVFAELEEITLFVDGLDRTIRYIVARYRETSCRGLSFEQLVHYAQDKGDTYRAGIGTQRGRKAPTPINQPAKQVRLSTKDPQTHALLAKSLVEFRGDSTTKKGAVRHDQQSEVHSLGAMSSDYTSKLPTGSTVVSEAIDETDPAFFMNRVRATRMSF